MSTKHESSRFLYMEWSSKLFRRKSIKILKLNLLTHRLPICYITILIFVFTQYILYTIYDVHTYVKEGILKTLVSILIYTTLLSNVKLNFLYIHWLDESSEFPNCFWFWTILEELQWAGRLYVDWPASPVGIQNSYDASDEFQR